MYSISFSFNFWLSLILFFCSSEFLSLGISITIVSKALYFFNTALRILNDIRTDLRTTGLNISSLTTSTGIYFNPANSSRVPFVTPISVKSVICSFGCAYISGISSFIIFNENDCHLLNNAPLVFLILMRHCLTSSDKSIHDF